MVFFYFLPFHRLLFILLIISFVCKSFYFWCNHICFSSYFCCLCFWSHIPNSCPRSIPRSFLSFSSFTVSGHTLKSSISSWILYMMRYKNPILFVFMWKFSFHRVIYGRKCSLPFVWFWYRFWRSVQLSSVAQSCPTLCDPMNCSTPGLPVHHQLPEFTKTHVHWVGDAIQPSHPLPSPSPPAFNLSQHQGLFKWVSSSNQVGKILEFQLQHQSFQWTPRTDLL